MLLLVVLGCSSPVESDPLGYDAGRSGLEGADGPWGVHLTVTADADPPNDFFAPTDAEGAPAEVGFASTTLVLLQGAGVLPERYHWLAQHLTSRGATVIVPHHGLESAWVDPTAGKRALAAALEAGRVSADAPVGFLGHGLGGAAAAALWAGDESIEGLALLAASAEADTDVESRESGSVLLMVGGEEEEATLTSVEAGGDRFNVTHAVVVVPEMAAADWSGEGTTHARWGIDGWVDSCVTSSVGTWPFYAAAHPEDVVGSPCDLMVMGG